MIRIKNIRSKNKLGSGYSVWVSTVGQTARTTDAVEDSGPAAEGPSLPDADRPDLTWLLHRAAQNMRIAFDEAVKAYGLAGARDWIVLSALCAGPRQTQLALAQSLGLDKTTMTSLLDRLEGHGFIKRCTDSHDRRARIPELTEDGRRVQAEVAHVRDQVEACALADFTPGERLLLRNLLTRLAGESDKATGSCI
jgi:DNA-binding MarR family transcriptional regulator